MQNTRLACADPASAGRGWAGVVYMPRCPRDALAGPLGVVPRAARQPERTRRRRHRQHRGSR